MMMVQPMMDAKHIHFTLDNSRAVMAVILADALRLQDIFVNLVSNAVKFTPEGGNITLVVECLKLEDQRVHGRENHEIRCYGAQRRRVPRPCAESLCRSIRRPQRRCAH